MIPPDLFFKPCYTINLGGNASSIISFSGAFTDVKYWVEQVDC